MMGQTHMSVRPSPQQVRPRCDGCVAQSSSHHAPIFRLLLKIAVTWDSLNVNDQFLRSLCCNIRTSYPQHNAHLSPRCKPTWAEVGTRTGQVEVLDSSYLLGLLAMIKCSICSYQCDNWYASDCWLLCHNNFLWGWRCSVLAQALPTCRLGTALTPSVADPCRVHACSGWLNSPDPCNSEG